MRSTSINTPTPTPIRVLMISKALVVGSYQRKLEEIAAHPNIDLTVIVPPYWRDARGKLMLERAFTQGYTLIEEPIQFNGNFHLHYYPRIGRHIRRIMPHVVHIDEEPYNLATFHTMRLARASGAKTLFFSWQNIKRDYPPPFAWMERYALKHADAGLIGNSEAESVWREKGYEGPLHLIPQFGVDPDIFSPAKEPEELSHFRIGYAGRLVDEKGVDLLIKAVSRLEGAWHLSILGDGPIRGELMTVAGLLNIGGSVRFDSPRASTTMPDYYRELDVLVLPSLTRPNWKEQFGRVLIEAMSCGVPVVGSDSGAIPEVIGDGGLTFAEGDIYALKDCLKSILWDVGLQRDLGRRGRERVLNHFTQKQIAAETVAVYREILGN